MLVSTVTAGFDERPCLNQVRASEAVVGPGFPLFVRCLAVYLDLLVRLDLSA